MTPARWVALLLPILGLAEAAYGGAPRSTQLGRLRVTIVDDATGSGTPARVEVLSEGGESRLPAAARAFPGDCGEAPSRRSRTDRGPDPNGSAPVRIADPAEGTTQFYALAPFEMSLPPGDHLLTVRKGPEYLVHRQSVRILARQVTVVDVSLRRWTHLAALGWYSADEHLHLPRADDRSSALLARLMQAEDLNVANLLQMGSYRGVVAAEQAGFGPAGVHQSGESIVASGQENPRAWLMGHGIVLGASSYIDFPDSYLVFGPFWRAAREQGALRGFAHYGNGVFLRDALLGSIDFLEVLQLDSVEYGELYRALNLGLRITPTAGTDFPCGLASPPGRERFYTRVEGALSYERWLDGVAQGRTFVSNGPMVDLRSGIAGMGDAIDLEAPGEIVVEASARFDPAEDEVEALEIVRDGRVIHRVEAVIGEAEIRVALPVAVEAPCWIAARVAGTKLRALPTVYGERRVAVAHTAPPYVRVGGAAQGPSAAERDEALARLRAQRQRILELEIGEEHDPVRQIDRATLERDRAGVVREFRDAERLLRVDGPRM